MDSTDNGYQLQAPGKEGEKPINNDDLTLHIGLPEEVAETWTGKCIRMPTCKIWRCQSQHTHTHTHTHTRTHNLGWLIVPRRQCLSQSNQRNQKTVPLALIINSQSSSILGISKCPRDSIFLTHGTGNHACVTDSTFSCSWQNGHFGHPPPASFLCAQARLKEILGKNIIQD